MQLNNFDIDDFLQNYWQKKPLLIPNAILDFKNPISADELAGLACEAEIESRLINSKEGNWDLQHGPFNEKDFNALTDQHWTLLVQAVDHWDVDVAQLLNYFRFIPNWRIDDVMVSYATLGGGVGPHYDNYDVFLLQGAGSRQWQLGPRCSADSPLLSGQPLHLLADFQPRYHCLLEAGDILYVPPLYSHCGIAADNDCMTYSIGFRAPSHGELLAEYCDERLSQLSEFDRYTDPALQLQQNAGEIFPEVINTVKQQMLEQFRDPTLIAQWFGRYMTQPKYSLRETDPNQLYRNNDIIAQLDKQIGMTRDSASRFAFSRFADQHILYVNGHSYVCHTSKCRQLAELLSGQTSYAASTITALISDEDSFTLILTLLNEGSVYFDEQDFD